MSWQTLLTENDGLRHLAPWVYSHGRQVFLPDGRRCTLKQTPRRPGWYYWRAVGRTAFHLSAALGADADAVLTTGASGFVVGDRLLADDASANEPINEVFAQSPTIELLPPDLSRFARIVTGTIPGSDTLYFKEEAWGGPGSEAQYDVTEAFLREDGDVSEIPHVTPALSLAFAVATTQRAEAQRRRAELEQERRRQALLEQLGSAEGRRALAQEDFAAGAKAALEFGGATLLDTRPGPRRTERVVQFRYANRGFECTCDSRTLRIIDSGICLTDHNTGESFDDKLTLETLPGVIRWAMDLNALVVYRHP